MKNTTNLQKAKAIVKELGRGLVAQNTYYQISFDTSDGEILIDEHFDCNSYQAYYSDTISTILAINGCPEGNYRVTVAQVKAMLDEKQRQENRWN